MPTQLNSGKSDVLSNIYFIFHALKYSNTKLFAIRVRISTIYFKNTYLHTKNRTVSAPTRPWTETFSIEMSYSDTSGFCDEPSKPMWQRREQTGTRLGLQRHVGLPWPAPNSSRAGTTLMQNSRRGSCCACAGERKRNPLGKTSDRALKASWPRRRERQKSHLPGTSPSPALSSAFPSLRVPVSRYTTGPQQIQHTHHGALFFSFLDHNRYSTHITECFLFSSRFLGLIWRIRTRAQRTAFHGTTSLQRVATRRNKESREVAFFFSYETMFPRHLAPSTDILVLFIRVFLFLFRYQTRNINIFFLPLLRGWCLFLIPL